MLFYDEVIDTQGLIEKLVDYKDLKVIKVAVVCFIFKGEKLILNRRGSGARDDVGKLQAIGGSVNKTDETFISALKREIFEETGNKDIKIGDFIGAFHDRKMDNETKEVVDWIILGYIGFLENGKLENKEKNRCVDFEEYTLEEIKPDELSISTYEFIKELKMMK